MTWGPFAMHCNEEPPDFRHLDEWMVVQNSSVAVKMWGAH